VALAGALLLALASPAQARLWDLTLTGTVGSSPFQIPLQVDLADPVGSATVLVSGIPVTVSHTADSFSLSASITLSRGCLVTVFLSGQAPVAAVGGSSTASGALSGGMVESCSAGAEPVLVGYQTYYIVLGESYFLYQVPVYAPGAGSTVVTSQSIAGSFAAASAGVVPAAEPQAVAGAVTLRTPFGSAALTPGADLSPGGLVQTGPDGTATIAFRDASQLVVSPNSLLVLPPLPTPTSVPSLVGLVRGQARITTPVPGGGATHPGIQTPTVTVRPAGTDFSVDYAQPVTTGTATVTVQQGLAEVEDRRGQRFAVAAGQQRTFVDSVPRVITILPMQQGAVLPGRTNTFLWTRYPGSAAYLIEYTLDPFGFADPNATAPQQPVNTLFIRPGLFTEAQGLVELALPLSTGLAAPGTRVFWRVFPTDAAGAVVPGARASEPATLIIQ
jgi:hypothetical protein